MKNLMIIIILIGFFSTCSAPVKKTTTSTLLPDTLFVFKNLNNSDVIKSHKFKNNRLYSDSSYKVEFVPIDTVFKSIFVAPILNNDLNVDAKYTKNFVRSYFISKQDKIGLNQPIVILNQADDYLSLMLLVLDTTLHPISHFVLSGGIYGGPSEVNDSITSLGEEKYSQIKGSDIESYILTKYVWTYAKHDSSIIDSVKYISKINVNGSITTQMTYRKRFTRLGN
jgi:hypothetical protein